MDKVAFYLPNAESGGAEKMIITLAGVLSEKGYDVSLILGLKQGAFLNDINPKISVLELGELSVLKSAFKLFRLVKNLKPKVFCVTKCHVNTVVSLFTPFLRKTKIVLREANTPSVEFSFASKYTRLIMNLGKFSYKLADNYVAVSEGVAKDMSDFYSIDPNRISTIYNPVVSGNLYTQSDENVDHKFFERSNDQRKPYVFVAVGRIMRQKDYPTLINSFYQAQLVNPELRLIVLGRVEEDNPDVAQVKKLISTLNLEDRISLVGFVSNPFSYMKKSDCFIQTSLFEGLPGTLVQAMALRLDIIATDCPSGPLEVLKGGEYGTLVNCGDVKGIKEKMLLYSNGEVNEKAPQEFIDQFTEQQSMKQYELLFNLDGK